MAHIGAMVTEGLKAKYEQLKAIEGESIAKATISKATGKSEATIRRWFKAGFPSLHDAYKTALACGCNKDEALTLARECFMEAKKAA